MLKMILFLLKIIEMIMSDEFKRRITEAFENKSEYLDLSNLDMDEIPYCLRRMPFVRKLNLSNNRISIIFEYDFFEIDNGLLELDLSGNRITNLLCDFRRSKNLTYLNLSNNKINFFPQIPKSLTHLNLSNNLLKSLPENILSFPNLKELNLENNKFEN